MSNSLQWFLSLVRRRWGVALTTFMFSCATGAVMYIVLPREYHATFALEITQEVPASSQVERLKDLFLAPKGATDSDEYATLVRSHGVCRQALERSGVITPSTKPEEADLMIYRLRNYAIAVERESNSNIMTVYVGAPEAGLAYTLAKNVMLALQDQERSSRVFRLEESRSNLERLLRTLETRVNRVRSARDAFAKVADIERRLDEFQTRFKAMRGELDKEVSGLRRQRQELAESYTEDWFEIRDLDEKIRFLGSFDDPLAAPAPVRKDALGAAARERRESYRTLRTEQQTLLEEFDQAILGAWHKHPDFDTLQAVDDELRRLQDNVDSIRRDVGRYDTAVQTSSSRHRILKEPIAPSPNNPSFPDPRRVLIITLLCALGVTGTIVYALAATDASFHTVEDVQHYAQMDVLAVIPHMDEAAHWSGGHPLAYGAHGEPSLSAEPFRALKSGIMFSIPKVARPVVLLTSSDREEGKSTVSSNLALAFAEDHKTLLLSCNMRRPTLHKILQVEEGPGLAEVLDGKIGWREAVQKTAIPNLSILAHGRICQNSSVLLTRPVFDKVVQEARAEYDAILIDSPPTLLLIDAAIMSRVADATVLVYSMGETQKESLFRALRILKKVEANVVGLAANTKRGYAAAPRRYYYYQQEGKRS